MWRLQFFPYRTEYDVTDPVNIWVSDSSGNYLEAVGRVYREAKIWQ